MWRGGGQGGGIGRNRGSGGIWGNWGEFERGEGNLGKDVRWRGPRALAGAGRSGGEEE